jgi:hypothetical protein
MKITSLEIERFGLWSGLTLPELKGGINVFDSFPTFLATSKKFR